MNHSRHNPRTWDTLTIYLKHAFSRKRSIDISTADERPRLIDLPGCRPKCGLQACLEAEKSEGLFWERIEAQILTVGSWHGGVSMCKTGGLDRFLIARYQRSELVEKRLFPLVVTLLGKVTVRLLELKRG